MPEPMTVPTTTAPAVTGPRARTRPGEVAGGVMAASVSGGRRRCQGVGPEMPGLGGAGFPSPGPRGEQPADAGRSPGAPTPDPAWSGGDTSTSFSARGGPGAPSEKSPAKSRAAAQLPAGAGR